MREFELPSRKRVKLFNISNCDNVSVAWGVDKSLDWVLMLGTCRIIEINATSEFGTDDAWH